MKTQKNSFFKFDKSIITLITIIQIQIATKLFKKNEILQSYSSKETII